jgi:murein DD-endopeptidase MepM/ murein hydrolase activator NlpD
MHGPCAGSKPVWRSPSGRRPCLRDIAPDTTIETVPTRLIERSLPLPAIRSEGDNAVYWREERIQRGDTIGSLLARAGVDDAEAMQFFRVDPRARPLYQLKPGKPVHVAVDEDGDLIALRFLTNGGERLTIERADDGFRAERSVPQEEVRTTLRSGEIRTSLFGAADAAGIPDSVIVALADVFAGDIDFYQDVQRGDRFSVVYEARFIEGEPAGTGRILAAEFVNRGIAHRAFFWRDENGNSGYFTDNGRSARSAFLRSPMEFSRITSGFTMARFHPILQEWREHKGIDYSAPTGTAVAHDCRRRGHVLGLAKRLRKRDLRAPPGHVLHGVWTPVRIAPELKVGAKVAQGDTIGYVGMTAGRRVPICITNSASATSRTIRRRARCRSRPRGHGPHGDLQGRHRTVSDSLALARSLPSSALAASQ